MFTLFILIIFFIRNFLLIIFYTIEKIQDLFNKPSNYYEEDMLIVDWNN